MMAAEKILPKSGPVLVVGLGLTGWSVVRYLVNTGLDVVVTDTRQKPPYLDALLAEFPGIPFLPARGEIEADEFDTVVASPGIAVHGPNVIGDVELFATAAKAPVVAITGSNGKSTVTMLVQRMLDCAGTRAVAGGNIGTPVLDLLSQPVPDYYVLELSSFQLDTTRSLRPLAAVVLNVSEDHLDRYSSMADYVSSKLRVYQGAARRIINRDDPRLRNLPRHDGDISFGLDEPLAADLGIRIHGGQRWLCYGDDRLVPESALNLHGEQNVSNMLAAIGVAGAALSPSDCNPGAERLSAGSSYTGLPHRCEPIASGDEMQWINDSKGTNVGATLAAIRGSTKPLILIAGGQGKGANFAPLLQVLDHGVREVILLGEDARNIEKALEGFHRIQHVTTLEAAIDRAREIGKPGDTVLFSPACASFDMFQSYVHRGDRFRQLVREKTGGTTR